MKIVILLRVSCVFYFIALAFRLEAEDLLLSKNDYLLIADSVELVSFFNALNGAGWSDSWDLNMPMNSWNGVVLNSDGCVKEIDLSNNNLSGVLIDLNLPFLEKLILIDNNIYGSIPDFSLLPSLKVLILDNNNFDTTVPDFSNVPFLEVLRISDCGLIGEIPNFSNLGNLIQLDLRGNELEGEVPDFTNLASLSYLRLSENQLTGGIPDFSNIPLVEVLSLNNNQLSGEIPNFGNMSALTSLLLINNQLQGTIPDFSNTPNLNNLNLSSNQLIGGVPDFSNLPLLSTLYLSFNQLSEPVPDFTNLPNLNGLSLNGNAFYTLLPDFTNLPSLLVLNIEDNQLDTLPVFTNLPGLVYMANNQLTFDDILPNLPVSNNDSYWPQDSIGQSQIIFASEGSNVEIDLGIDDLIPNNNYQWYKDGALYNVASNDNSLIINDIQQEDAGIYTCKISNNNASLLTLISRPITLFVGDAPLIITIDSIVGNNCPNLNEGLIDIEVSGGVPPYNYLWSNGELTEDLHEITNGQYLITISDANMSAIVDTIILISNIDLPLAYAGEDGFICGNNSAYLNVEIVDTLFGQWSSPFSSAIIETSASSNTLVYGLDIGENVFIWTISSEDCPTYDMDEITITYVPYPLGVSDTFKLSHELEYFEFDVLKNDSFYFNNTEVEVVEFYGNEIDYLSNGVFSIQLDNINKEEIFTFRYKLCQPLCDDFCDTATVVLLFFTEDGEDIPNTITPNGDGINDVFELPENVYNFSKNDGIIIFNRWGNVVYKATPYLNDWTGKTIEGKELPQGTYYYRYILNLVNEKIYMGDVTILK